MLEYWEGTGKVDEGKIEETRKFLKNGQELCLQDLLKTTLFLNHFNDLISIIKMPQNLSWSCILVVEERSVIYGKFILLPKLALVSANEYEKRFDELLNMGYAWINMSALGIMDNAFIVEIGLPIQGRNAPRNKVSVNYSGPMIIDGKPLWDLSSKVKILE